MKSYSTSKKLLIEEIRQCSQKMREASRGLSVAELIKIIRTQLGMSQESLAKLAGVPQSTVSRVESGLKNCTLSTLEKILKALSCDLIIVPLLKDPIDAIRRRQARRVAEKRIGYLTGTMSLEDQRPDAQFTQELLREEEERLLHGPNKELWEA